jgi:hypothetical protein
LKEQAGRSGGRDLIEGGLQWVDVSLFPETAKDEDHGEDLVVCAGE